MKDMNARTTSGMVMTGGASSQCCTASHSRFPEENNENEPHHVERGQECGEKTERENRRIAFVGDGEDRVFAEKSAEPREAGQRKRADTECEKCYLHSPARARPFSKCFARDAA